MITQIIELMRALDYVRGSPFLTAEQKVTVAKELSSSMPPKALCTNAQRTFEIAEGLFADFRPIIETKEGPKEDPKTEQRLPARGQSPHVQPRTPPKANGRPQKVA
jgi:hypothetical protein